MDGNGRWAKRRMMPRGFGHREGVKVIDRIADAVFSRGIGCLTLFAFSTENWKRPEEEVDGLLDLFKKYLRKKTPLLAEKGRGAQTTALDISAARLNTLSENLKRLTWSNYKVNF